MVKLLLDHGAKVDLADNAGVTPLMRAARRNESIVRLFFHHNASVDKQDANGQTALMNAVTMTSTMWSMF